MMNLSSSFDHRVVDGQQAAQRLIPHSEIDVFNVKEPPSARLAA